MEKSEIKSHENLVAQVEKNVGHRPEVPVMDVEGVTAVEAENSVLGGARPVHRR